MRFADINWRKWQPEPSRAEVVAAAVRRLKRRDRGLHVTELFDVAYELLCRVEALEAAEADRNAVMDDFWATYSRVSGEWASTPNWRDAAKIIRGR